MGRGKIKDELKKENLSVTLCEETVNNILKHEIKNKSKLINSLLVEYFNEQEKKK